MSRTKGGIVTRRRHKKIIKMTKGMYGTRHNLFRRANEALMKSLWYAYRDRRTRKRDLRRLWIARINAAARQNGTTYSRLIHGMKQVLAENCLPIFTSDGLKMYFYALTAHFGYWFPQEGRRKRAWMTAKLSR